MSRSPSAADRRRARLARRVTTLDALEPRNLVSDSLRSLTFGLAVPAALAAIDAQAVAATDQDADASARRWRRNPGEIGAAAAAQPNVQGNHVLGQGRIDAIPAIRPATSDPATDWLDFDADPTGAVAMSGAGGAASLAPSGALAGGVGGTIRGGTGASPSSGVQTSSRGAISPLRLPAPDSAAGSSTVSALAAASSARVSQALHGRPAMASHDGATSVAATTDWTLSSSSDSGGSGGELGPSTVSIEATDPDASESGDTGQFTISRAGGDISSSLTVYFESISGGATQGTDYSASPDISGGWVTIPANSTSQVITITPNQDSDVEGPEDILLTLGTSFDYVRAPDPQDYIASVTIADDDSDPPIDPDPPQVSITASDPDAGEGNPVDPGQFTVARTGDTSTALTVSYTVGGTATSGSDYQALSGSVTIPAGESSTTIAVTPIDDSEQGEDFESVVATLQTSAGYTLDANAKEATVSIADDDGRITSDDNTDVFSTGEQPIRVGDCEVSADAAGGNLTYKPGADCDCDCGCPDDGLFSPPEPVYHSDGNPHPVVTVEWILPANQPIPDQIEAQLTFGGIQGPAIFYSTAGLATGQRRLQFALQADATTLGTGHYDYTVDLTTHSGGVATVRTVHGDGMVFNQINSAYGNRWGLTGVEQIIPDASGAALIRSDNTGGWYANQGGDFVTPAGSLNALIKVSPTSGFVLTSRDGSQQQFDAQGRLSARVDRNGNTSTYEYNGLTRELSKFTDPFGRVTTYTYSGGLLASITDFAGRVTTYGYDSAPHLKTITRPDPDGLAGPLQSPVTYLDYDNDTSLLTGITDHGDHVTTITYSFARRVESVTRPVIGTWHLEPARVQGIVQTATGQGTPSNPAPAALMGPGVAQYISAGNEDWLYRTDRFGYAVEVTDALGRVTTTVRNANGLATEITQPDPDGLTGSLQAPTTTYTYDALGNLTKVVWPDDTTRIWTYDLAKFSQLTSVQDENGQTTTYTLDSQGNRLTEVDPLGRTTTYAYGPHGQVTAITRPDPDGGGSQIPPVTTYDYNAHGQVTTQTNPDGTIQTWVYDIADNVTAATDEAGARTTYAYDAIGRLTALTEPDGRGSARGENRPNETAARAFDGDNATKWLDFAAVSWLQYQFNTPSVINAYTLTSGNDTASFPGRAPRDWRLLGSNDGSTWTTLDTQTNAADTTNTNTSLYILTNNSTAYTYYRLDISASNGASILQLAEFHLIGAPPLPTTTDYAYDDDGQLGQITDPQGRVTSYGYDAAGRLTTVTLPNPNGPGGLAPTTFTYDSEDRVTSETDPLGRTTTYTYDVVGRLIAVTRPDADTPGGPNTPVTTYGYDDLDRLTTVTRPDPDVLGGPNTPVTTYTYDDLGRLATVIDPLGRTTTLGYDPVGRLTTVIDPLQRVTTSGYDVAGQLVSVARPDPNVLGGPNATVTTYTYDGLGRLATVTDPETRTTTLGYDARDRVTGVTRPDPDGVNQADLAVYRPSNQTWYIIQSSTGTPLTSYPGSSTTTSPVFGAPGDLPAAADFDGDGKTDLAVFRPSTGVWLINQSSTGTALVSYPGMTAGALPSLGTTGDVPVPADYDGDGKADIAVYRPNTGTWYIWQSSTGTPLTSYPGLSTTAPPVFGGTGDLPAPADYDGDGKTDIALFRPSNATWYIIQSATATPLSSYPGVPPSDFPSFGGSTDRPVPADYDGDGKADLAVFHPSNSTWYIMRSATGTPLTSYPGISGSASYPGVPGSFPSFGGPGDIPVPAGFDGGGQAATTTRYGYDAVGNQTTVTDPLRRTTTTIYDAQGRVVRVTTPDPDGPGVQGPATTRYGYDRVGNRTTVTDPLGRVTTTTYDALNRPVTIIDPLAGVTTLGYDAVGNRTSLIDPVENQTTFVYDRLDRLTAVIDPRNASTTYAYDLDDQLTEQTDRDGRRTAYDYDDLGRVTDERWLDGSGLTVRTISSHYDLGGQLWNVSDPDATLSFSYDNLGRVTAAGTFGIASGQPILTLSSTYDAVGNRLSLTDNLSSGPGQTTYTYDALDRVTTITRATGGVSGPRVGFRYDPADRLIGLSRTEGGAVPPLTTAFRYDAADRLTGLSHQVAGVATLAAYAYSYDAASRLTGETNAEGTVTYSYDATDQLTGVAGSRSESYAYDANGNRTSSGYVVETGNRLTSSPGFTYTYDAEGNRLTKTDTSSGAVTTYAYDHRNRMTGVTTTSGGVVTMQASYTYDGFDRRIRTVVDADGAGSGAPVTTWTVYDGANAYADFNGSGTLTERYLHGPAVDMLLARTDASGSAAWYLTDRLGSVRDIASTSGVVLYHTGYDGYGNKLNTSGSGGDKWGYTGRESDTGTDLQSNRGRYYDAAIGQMTQEDPIGFGGGDANLRRYVGNSPTNFVDPDGLQKQRIPGSAAIPIILNKLNPHKGGEGTMSDPVAYARAAQCGAANSSINNVARAGIEIGLRELRWSKKQFPGDDRRQNAIRHAAWTAMMSIQFGEQRARDIAYAHEKYGSDGWEDTIIDFNNNEVGYAIASFYRGTGGSASEKYEEIEKFFHFLVLARFNNEKFFEDAMFEKCNLARHIDQVDFNFGRTIDEMIRFYEDNVYYKRTDKPILPGDRKPTVGRPVGPGSPPLSSSGIFP